MTDDFISDIRKRHECDAMIADHLLHFPEHYWMHARAGQKAHDDRAFLLAEVERLQQKLAIQAMALLAEVERLTRDRDEARAEVERLREALRDALDGLRYWVPQTSVGAVEKCRIMEKGIEALEVKSAVDRCLFLENGIEALEVIPCPTTRSQKSARGMSAITDMATACIQGRTTTARICWPRSIGCAPRSPSIFASQTRIRWSARSDRRPLPPRPRTDPLVAEGDRIRRHHDALAARLPDPGAPA